jgi:uncharacterized protein YqjF (DUF2071 family)
MRQRWRRLAFLHWPVDPAVVRRLLPAGLDVDVWEGSAYLGIVPFTISGTRPPLLPPVPGLSSFHELNLRTYVHRQGRDPGVWFFSLDAASRLAVLGARLTYKLPYFHAHITMSEGHDGLVNYSSRRASPDTRAHFACTYGPAGPVRGATPGSLEFYLVERYLLYSWDGKRLRSARVWHHPYPLQPAIVEDVTEQLTPSAGLEVSTTGTPLAHYADEVDVRIYRPRGVERERLSDAK